VKKIVLLFSIMILVGSVHIAGSDNNYISELDNPLVLSIEQYDDLYGYIYLYYMNTGELQKISMFSGYGPVWDSRKEKIVFGTDRDYDPYEIGDPPYNPDIYIINRDGTGEKRLTDNKISYGQTVCKFNDQIFYITDFIDEKGKIKKICSMDLAGDNKKEIFNSELDITTLELSPDGKELVFSTYDGIYKYRINNGKLEKLKAAEEIGIYYANPKYSPNGDEILYFKGYGTFTRMSICIMDKNGQNNREIAPNIAFYDAAWSPDGERIIFMTEEDDANRLYIINKDGTGIEEVKLPLDKPYKIYGIDW
jgi:Tol biopolymer transport system component